MTLNFYADSKSGYFMGMVGNSGFCTLYLDSQVCLYTCSATGLELGFTRAVWPSTRGKFV